MEEINKLVAKVSSKPVADLIKPFKDFAAAKLSSKKYNDIIELTKLGIIINSNIRKIPIHSHMHCLRYHC